MSKMELISPAKVNLFLKVVSKRRDGYHELFTLMCRIGLFDRINIFPGAKKNAVHCPHPRVPTDDSNLALRAAELFFKRLEKKRYTEIHIEKNIPVAAGLGGGSSNAASVLAGLNRYYGDPLSMDEMMEAGLQLGADVPFFLFARPALAKGVGEKLVPWNGLSKYRVLLVCPDFSVSTGEIFGGLNLALTKCEKDFIDLFFNVRHFDPKRHMCNDLETVTASGFPEIERAKTALIGLGAEGALMSGSGPVVFGLFKEGESLREASRELSQMGIGRVLETHLRDV